MGRKSLVAAIHDELGYMEGESGTWLVLYDFLGKKPSTRFWTNLNKISEISGSGALVQFSVFMTTDKKSAYTAVELVKHYGGQPMLFKGKSIELN
jgi:hypothetical protein